MRFGSYTGAPAIFSRKLRGKEGGFTASYANETAAGNFVHHDFIVVEGVKQNYWIVEPSLTKTAREASAPPEEGRILLGNDNGMDDFWERILGKLLQWYASCVVEFLKRQRRKSLYLSDSALVMG